MRELDRAAIERRNIPSLRLMENAGKAVVEEMERFFGPLRGKAVTIVAGKGQNGGDGLVTARLLRKRRCQARVVLLASLSALTGDAATNLNKFQRARGRCLAVETPAQLTSILNPLLQDSDLVVDAIFGTGLNAPVQGLPATAITLMNASRKPIVAIHLPSGLDPPASPGRPRWPRRPRSGSARGSSRSRPRTACRTCSRPSCWRPWPILSRRPKLARCPSRLWKPCSRSPKPRPRWPSARGSAGIPTPRRSSII